MSNTDEKLMDAFQKLLDRIDELEAILNDLLTTNTKNYEKRN